MQALLAAIIVSAAVAVACGSGSSGQKVPAQPGAAPTTAAKHSAPAGSITKQGVLIVGTEVKPGAYRAEVPADSFGCYYARLSSLDESDIIANGLGKPGDVMTVTIRKSDKAFKTDDCGIWVPIEKG